MRSIVFRVFSLCIIVSMCAGMMCNCVFASGTDDIFLNTDYISLSSGGTYTFRTVANGSVTYSSDDTGVAVVSANGTVTGVGAGTTTVRANCGGAEAVCAVEVTVPETPLASGINIKQPYVIGTQNDTFQLEVEVASDIVSSSLTWSTSNSAVATVSNTGLVKIVVNNRQIATITVQATDGNSNTFTDTCHVYVHFSGVEAISTYTHISSDKNDSEQLLQYMHTTDGTTFTHYSLLLSGPRWADTGIATGEVRPFLLKGKESIWAVVAFKAPYTGKLGIYLNGGVANSSDSLFKIQHNTTKIYPTGTKEYLTVNSSSSDVTTVGSVLCLPDLTLQNPANYTSEWATGVAVDVQKGDYIYLMAKGGTGLTTYTRFFEFKYISKTPASVVEKHSVNLSPQSVDLEVGETATLSANYEGDEIVYTSTDENVATVDESGLVTITGVGSCKIIATVDGVVADYCNVTGNPVRNILMNKRYIKLEVGQNSKLKAAYYPISALETMNWSSSNSGVASVDGNGNIIGVSTGTAVVTAAKDEKKAECIVEVIPAQSGIYLDYNDIWVDAGGTFTLKATVDEQYAEEKIVWTSDNADIATVDKNGIITGSGANVGMTKIKAALESYPEIYSECTVAVGKLEQYKLFNATDNSDAALWQYSYALNGATGYTKFTEGGSVSGRLSNGTTFVQAADISFVAGSETVRMFRAPVTGKINISVNSGTQLTNSNVSNPAEAKFSVKFRGKEVDTFMFKSKAKEDSGYYTTTAYNGAETAGAASSSAYDTDISFEQELGTIELEVCQGEYIYFIYKGITGNGFVSHYNGGIYLAYEEIGTETELSTGCDSLNLPVNTIYQFSDLNAADEENLNFYTGDESVAQIGGAGSIKAVSAGNTVVYVTNADNSLMDYVEVRVTDDGLYATEPSYDIATGNVSVTLENRGLSNKKAVVVAITRDSYGRPIKVFKSEEITVPAQDNVIAGINGALKETSKKIEIFVWQCDTKIIPVRASKVIEFN